MIHFPKIALIAVSILVIISLQQPGRFVGKVVVEWLDDGRKMKLIEDFSYIDPTGKTWKTPKGSVIDGASIPKIFWTAIGGPYEENYRKASVVHDYFCEPPYKDTWENVHLMFYDACITSEITVIKAKIMYAAVYAGGPRWTSGTSQKSGNKSKSTPIKVDILEEKFKNISLWIEQNNPSIEKISDTLDTVVREIKII